MRRVSPLPPYLADRYRSWSTSHYTENRASFERLSREGQTPGAMVVACCDSRVAVEALFAPVPGEIFVHRNIANLVPAPIEDEGHHGTASAIEYGVTVLNVAHLIVMGHSGCGGVEGCRRMCEGGAPELGGTYVGRWLQEMRAAHAEVAGIADEAERQTAMEKAAVGVSLGNLLRYPFVAAAIQAGRLSLHGLWVEIGAGRMESYDGRAGRFLPV